MSFLVDWKQQVSFGGRLSVICQLVCGVLQGSVLSPLLFILYNAEIFDFVTAHGLSAHSYAEYNVYAQVYINTSAAKHRRLWIGLPSMLSILMTE